MLEEITPDQLIIEAEEKEMMENEKQKKKKIKQQSKGLAPG